jgi:thymidylate synthase ThyX
MAYECKIICDSLNPYNNKRITTFSITLPRFILPEFLTHRMLSRNSQSSRAIPTEKLIARVVDDPFVPESFGSNIPGMQAGPDLGPEDDKLARLRWLDERDDAVRLSRFYLGLGVHKQIANRPLELYSWHTVIVTATEWENFFNLRTHKFAQPEFQRIAKMMKEGYESSTGCVDRYHLPLCPDLEDLFDQYEINQICMISAGRCARVSYLTHDGHRDPKADIDLATQLMKNGHMSPFEHVARASTMLIHSGNFIGWSQFRKQIAGEDVWRENNE